MGFNLTELTGDQVAAIVAALQALEPGLVTTTQAGKLAPDAECILNGFIKEATSGNKGLMSKAFATLLESPEALVFTKGKTLTQNAGFHNSIFRGKSLGSSVTAAQWSAIGNGTFDDLFIGDYWTINSIVWRIAAFDYWYRCGDTECTTHHAVIVPDSNLLVADGSTTHWLHHEDKTDGAYVGTDFYQGANGNNGKSQCRSKAQSAFGSSHILTHREHFQNSAMSGSTNVGYATAGTWYDSDIDIMNEPMVYGSKIYGDVKAGGNIPNMYTIDKSQLPLFALAPSFICNRAYWWLRDVVSAAYFAYVNIGGHCHYIGASASWVGVRPAFGIRA